MKLKLKRTHPSFELWWFGRRGASSFILPDSVMGPFYPGSDGRKWWVLRRRRRMRRRRRRRRRSRRMQVYRYPGKTTTVR